MIEVIGVRFKKAGKIYYFDPGEHNITKDSYVIVETVRGIEFGQVVITNKRVDEEDIVLPLKKLLGLQLKKIRQQLRIIVNVRKSLFKLV